MLSEEKAMEILEAYDLTNSLRATAALCGVDHKTVRRFVAARAAGLDPAASVGRPVITEPFADKITEWIDRSSGRVRADVVHQKLAAMGFVGSERTTRRVVAQLKADYVRANHRIYKPWVTEPGLWLQFDYGSGPIVGGEPPRCSAPGWPGRAFGSSWPWLTARSLHWCRPSTRTLRAIGGAPTYLLTDNEKTVTTTSRGWSGRAQPRAARRGPLLRGGHPHLRGGRSRVQGRHRGNGAHRQGRRVASSRQSGRRVPDFASLERACAAASDRFNTRVHRETGERPIDRLALEQAQLHRLPPEPYTVAFGETRTVSWSSLISFQGARYSVPHQLCAEVVFVRQMGDEVVIVATEVDGAKEVARHPVGGQGPDDAARRALSTPAQEPRTRAQGATTRPRVSSSLSVKGPGVTSLKRLLRVPRRSTSACVKPLLSGARRCRASSTRPSGWPHWPVDSNKATSARSPPSAASHCDGSQRITPSARHRSVGPPRRDRAVSGTETTFDEVVELDPAAPSALSARGQPKMSWPPPRPSAGTRPN